MGKPDQEAGPLPDQCRLSALSSADGKIGGGPKADDDHAFRAGLQAKVRLEPADMVFGDGLVQNPDG
jgi:hypothetical protein